MNDDPVSCQICEEQAERLDHLGDYYHRRCPRCGEYKLTRSASPTVADLTPAQKINLSGWIRHQNELGSHPVIRADDIEPIANLAKPPFAERATRLLGYIIKHQSELGKMIDLVRPALRALTYTSTNDEFRVFVDFLKERGFLDRFLHYSHAFVTPSGYIYYESTLQVQPLYSQGFVAMWFDVSMDDPYAKGFDPGIRRAGYDPLKVNLVEHNRKIDDEIIAQIRKSRFLVADFTGHRGGVYFEAGYAMGLGLPVIWTCRDDDLINLHFDIRQFNMIDWKAPEDLATRLRNRIEATIGPGPRTSLN